MIYGRGQSDLRRLEHRARLAKLAQLVDGRHRGIALSDHRVLAPLHAFLDDAVALRGIELLLDVEMILGAAVPKVEVVLDADAHLLQDERTPTLSEPLLHGDA